MHAIRAMRESIAFLLSIKPIGYVVIDVFVDILLHLLPLPLNSFGKYH